MTSPHPPEPEAPSALAPLPPSKPQGTSKLGEWGRRSLHARWRAFAARVEKRLPPRRPPPD